MVSPPVATKLNLLLLQKLTAPRQPSNNFATAGVSAIFNVSNNLLSGVFTTTESTHSASGAAAAVVPNVKAAPAASSALVKTAPVASSKQQQVLGRQISESKIKWTYMNWPKKSSTTITPSKEEDKFDDYQEKCPASVMPAKPVSAISMQPPVVSSTEQVPVATTISKPTFATSSVQQLPVTTESFYKPPVGYPVASAQTLLPGAGTQQYVQPLYPQVAHPTVVGSSDMTFPATSNLQVAYRHTVPGAAWPVPPVQLPPPVVPVVPTGVAPQVVPTAVGAVRAPGVPHIRPRAIALAQAMPTSSQSRPVPAQNQSSVSPLPSSNNSQVDISTIINDQLQRFRDKTEKAKPDSTSKPCSETPQEPVSSQQRSPIARSWRRSPSEQRGRRSRTKSPVNRDRSQDRISQQRRERSLSRTQSTERDRDSGRDHSRSKRYDDRQRRDSRERNDYRQQTERTRNHSVDRHRDHKVRDAQRRPSKNQRSEGRFKNETDSSDMDLSDRDHSDQSRYRGSATTAEEKAREYARLERERRHRDAIFQERQHPDTSERNRDPKGRQRDYMSDDPRHLQEGREPWINRKEIDHLEIHDDPRHFQEGKEGWSNKKERGYSETHDDSRHFQEWREGWNNRKERGHSEIHDDSRHFQEGTEGWNNRKERDHAEIHKRERNREYLQNREELYGDEDMQQNRNRADFRGSNREREEYERRRQDHPRREITGEFEIEDKSRRWGGESRESRDQDTSWRHKDFEHRRREEQVDPDEDHGYEEGDSSRSRRHQDAKRWEGEFERNPDDRSFERSSYDVRSFENDKDDWNDSDTETGHHGRKIRDYDRGGDFQDDHEYDWQDQYAERGEDYLDDYHSRKETRKRKHDVDLRESEQEMEYSRRAEEWRRERNTYSSSEEYLKAKRRKLKEARDLHDEKVHMFY